MWLHGILNGDDKRLYHQHLYPPVMKHGLLDNWQLIDHGDDFPIETSILARGFPSLPCLITEAH